MSVNLFDLGRYPQCREFIARVPESNEKRQYSKAKHKLDNTCPKTGLRLSFRLLKFPPHLHVCKCASVSSFSTVHLHKSPAFTPPKAFASAFLQLPLTKSDKTLSVSELLKGEHDQI